VSIWGGKGMMGWVKDVVSWKCGGTLYLSIPFTWLLPKAKDLSETHNGKTIAGGPAVDLVWISWAETPNQCDFDTLSMHNPLATFTTKGCPNRCKFCAVPKIEGDFRELETWKIAPIVCDNNILASSKRHFEHVIDSLLIFEYVDFNQGLDSRLFTSWHCEQMARLRGVKMRFALDSVAQEKPTHDAICLARKYRFRDFGVYVLIGFNDTPEDAQYRLELVRSWGIWPTPMRYQPLNTLEKDSYITPGWTDRKLRRMVRYYSKLRWLEHISFDDYIHDQQDMYAGDLFGEAAE